MHKSVMPGDDHTGTRHFGAWAETALVGVCTLLHEPEPECGTAYDWRLRGMAVDPDLRRHGIGGMLLDASCEHAKSIGGHRIWCNARSPAVSFYIRHGFQIIGDEFVLNTIGPHYRMWKSL